MSPITAFNVLLFLVCAKDSRFCSGALGGRPHSKASVTQQPSFSTSIQAGCPPCEASLTSPWACLTLRCHGQIASTTCHQAIVTPPPQFFRQLLIWVETHPIGIENKTSVAIYKFAACRVPPGYSILATR